VPLDRERRARFRFLLRAHARAGRITPKTEWVSLALLKRLGEDDQCDPTPHDPWRPTRHAAPARRAGIHA
jgi:hypothetical protein